MYITLSRECSSVLAPVLNQIFPCTSLSLLQYYTPGWGKIVPRKQFNVKKIKPHNSQEMPPGILTSLS